MKESVIVRVDADTRIGTGHVMRCLALAQAWHDIGARVVCVTACRNEWLLLQLREAGFELHLLAHPYPHPVDWEITSQVLAAHSDAWVVLDGYHFDSAYQRRIKAAGHRLLAIDDTAHLDHYDADLVLNQNIHAEQLPYRRGSSTRLLLGTKYVLLRSEFQDWRGWQRDIPAKARKVLVTLGGSDYENDTLKVAGALRGMKVDGLEYVVVVGATNPHYPGLRSTVRRWKCAPRVVRNVSNMSELMAWADVAVSGAGSTCWELAFMGLPSIALVLAENQWPLSEGLDAMGVVINLGWGGDISPHDIAQALTRLLVAEDRRREMANRGRQLVDGLGSGRVLKHVRRAMLTLRKVREDDCDLLWQWANDPDVRAVSFSSQPIPWERHVKWFKAKVMDPTCVLFIATHSNGAPVGQVRYDIDGKQATVSVSIDRNFRGKGYGSAILGLSAQEVFASLEVSAIHAYVKRDNEASIWAFEQAEYTEMGTTSVHGHDAVHFTLRKSE
jgi:UDP-2,4-diacetamido-2,4,6-trideoxy-beta-L-altropyranose hydrolase